jgi:hypothetical protein
VSTNHAASNAQALCPFWARFFQRPDGYWLAYCSEEACWRMDEQRPGWRDTGEWLRASRCLFGFPEDVSRKIPMVLVGRGAGNEAECATFRTQAAPPIISAEAMTDEVWGSYIREFMAWRPAPGMHFQPSLPHVSL